jgi:hypothetical protein
LEKKYDSITEKAALELHSSNIPKETFINDQKNKRPIEKELRYAAYTSPSVPLATPRQQSPRLTASGLLKETLSHVHARRASGSELIELANRSDKGIHQANYRAKRLSKDVDTVRCIFFHKRGY